MTIERSEKALAKKRAADLGHTLGRFYPLTHACGVQYVAGCERCTALVYVRLSPAAQTDGLAVEVACPLA